MQTHAGSAISSEARSRVEAMSLGPESLTRALCQPRYRSDGETIMAQPRHPTASDMSTKTCHSHNGEAPLAQRTLDDGVGAGASWPERHTGRARACAK